MIYTRYYLVVAVMFAALVPSGSAVASPIQFVDGIWLDQDAVYQDEAVRVYVALRNSASADITGTVTMYAEDELIGTSTVSALPGRLIETWADWQPNETGTFAISATLDNIVVHHTTEEEAVAESITIEHPGVTVSPPPEPETSTSSPSEQRGTSSIPGVDHHSGFEQWLPLSQGRTAIEQFTEQIQATADRLQQHERSLRDRFHGTSTPEDDETTATTSEPAMEAVTDPVATTATTTSVAAALWGPIKDWVVRNSQNAYIGIVAFFRWLFSSPILIQILLLLGLLWLMYRTAKHFGSR